MKRHLIRICWAVSVYTGINNTITRKKRLTTVAMAIATKWPEAALELSNSRSTDSKFLRSFCYFFINAYWPSNHETELLTWLHKRLLEHNENCCRFWLPLLRAQAACTAEASHYSTIVFVWMSKHSTCYSDSPGAKSRLKIHLGDNFRLSMANH